MMLMLMLKLKFVANVWQETVRSAAAAAAAAEEQRGRQILLVDGQVVIVV